MVFCPSAPEWGPIAAWVSAVGTIGTLFWAVSSGLSLRRQAASEKRQEQANGIYAYIDHSGNELVLRVGNGSPVPVYDVFLYYMVSPEHDTLDGWEKVEEGIARAIAEGSHADVPVAEDVPIVQTLPHGDFKVEGVSLNNLRALSPRVDLSRLFGVDVVFTDAAGNRWTRRARGRLETEKRDPMRLERWASRRALIGYASTLPYAKLVRVTV